MKLKRQIRYYCLRFTRLRGEPRDLALGIAFGIFAGMMPIMPFQTALAVALALFFRVSKITAALGTWISNPLNWYFLYYSNYKIGALILNLSQKNKDFSSIMASIGRGDEVMVIIGKLAGAGSAIIAAFLIGGILLGSVSAIPSYFIFLRLFNFIRAWRERRRDRRRWLKQNQ